MNSWSTQITAILLVSMPILGAIAYRRRIRVLWWIYFAGVAAYLLGQLFLLPIKAMSSWLNVLSDQLLVTDDILVAALLSGLAIEIARLVIFVVLKQARTKPGAIMVGLGSGGFIVMILAVLMATRVSTLPANLAIDANSFHTLNSQSMLIAGFFVTDVGSFSNALSALVLAFLLIIVEINASVIVMSTFKPKRWWMVAVAVIYHGSISAFVLIGQVRFEDNWMTVAILSLFALPVLVIIGRSMPRSNLTRIDQDGSLGSEFSLLIASFQKELLYQWRTRRILIIGAIFLVFGMASPLLAKFTPSLLGLVEGGEQFVDLIPTPTAADAIGQYIKNLTQFGFILAIVIGMGAIAGEKERNTAAMILSKPIPRWVFLVSKFVAQAVVYTVGFFLAMIAAYYYTVFLFGRIDLLAFFTVNCLLLLWLLVFVAVTLFGSTIGRSTAAAAGIGLVCSVLILVVGTLPRYGSLAPGGLVNWASSLFMGSNVLANSGSLITSLVLILLAILGALAVFEEQEV